MENKHNTTIFIKDEVTEFSLYNNSDLIQQIYLKIGYKQIAEKYFKSFLTNESEIEYSINVIENEIMNNKELNNFNNILFSNDIKIKDIIYSFNNESILTIQNIESIFTECTKLVMSNPRLIKNEFSEHENYAIILILREIMHHLNFENLILIQ
ncbi:MAG: hypothetical protein U0354_00805 [Candidatus Sericytochromatia bacterium]